MKQQTSKEAVLVAAAEHGDLQAGASRSGVLLAQELTLLLGRPDDTAKSANDQYEEGFRVTQGLLDGTSTPSQASKDALEVIERGHRRLERVAGFIHTTRPRAKRTQCQRNQHRLVGCSREAYAVLCFGGSWIPSGRIVYERLRPTRSKRSGTSSGSRCVGRGLPRLKLTVTNLGLNSRR